MTEIPLVIPAQALERLIDGAKTFLHVPQELEPQAGELLRLIPQVDGVADPEAAETFSVAFVQFSAPDNGIRRGWVCVALQPFTAPASTWEPYASGICRDCSDFGMVNRAGVCVSCNPEPRP